MAFDLRSSNSPMLVQLVIIKPRYLNVIGLTRPKVQIYINSISLLRSIIRGSTQSMIPLYWLLKLSKYTLHHIRASEVIKMHGGPCLK